MLSENEKNNPGRRRPGIVTNWTPAPPSSKKDPPDDEKYVDDAVAFARERLNFDPDETQSQMLTSTARRGILNCTRQWGKSTISAAMAVHRAHCLPGSLVIVVSPSGRQSGEFLRKAKGFAMKLGLKPKGDGDNEISMVFPNKSRIVGLPGSEATVRGFSSVALLLIDEASRVPDPLYKAVRPFLAVGGGALWLMSTPFGKRGFFYEEWANGGDRWERLQVPATKCARISKEFLDDERASMGDRWFRQEYLCEFEDTGGSIFSRDVIERAFSPQVKPLF